MQHTPLDPDEAVEADGTREPSTSQEPERQARWRLPLLGFVLSLALLSLTSFERVTEPSEDTHFVYLAETFNSMIKAKVDPSFAGRKGKVAFELDRRPPHRNDWASYWEIPTRGGETVRGIWLDKQGEGRFKTLDGEVIFLRKSDQTTGKRQRFFVSFPPGPAWAMMPLVAVWGHDTNDVWFTLFFAALNVALMIFLLQELSRKGYSQRSRNQNLWLTLFFGFGSAHLWCSTMGQVWFTALTIGVTWTLLYMICTIDLRRPFWAGVFLALAFSTRTPLLFSAVFFFLFAFFPGGRLRRNEWKPALQKVALFCLAPTAVGLWLLYCNHVRFSSWTEFGHTYLAAGSLERIQTYGLFNLQFLSKNLSAMWTLLPRFQPTEPYVVISKHGMSLLLTTPVLIYCFRPLPREGAPETFRWRALWITVAAIALPALFYQNTGYEQFGYRFAMDYLPYLTVLLALAKTPMTWVYKLAILWGVAANLFGAITFKRFSQFYHNDFFL